MLSSRQLWKKKAKGIDCTLSGYLQTKKSAFTVDYGHEDEIIFSES
jgi:hypothetical protein